MKKTRWEFILAGTLLLLGACFSQILEKSISQVLILGLSSTMFLALDGTKSGRRPVVCEIKTFKRNPLMVLGIGLGALLIFGGIGLLVGKLLYHMIH